MIDYDGLEDRLRILRRVAAGDLIPEDAAVLIEGTLAGGASGAAAWSREEAKAS